MSTTIRIEDEAKETLRRLQELWRKGVGESASQQELLARSLSYALRHAEDFIRENSWKPLSRDEIRALQNSLSADMGANASQEVDEILYGWKK